MEKIVFSWPMIAIAAALCLAALWGIFKVAWSGFVLRKEIAELQKRIDNTNAATAASEEKLKALRTEEGLEREARGKLNLKKPGEEVVVFVGEALPRNTVGEGGLASVWNMLKKWLNF